jgi:hypothetical protein
MQNPYDAKPDYQFWRRSFANRAPTEVDLVTKPRFTFSPKDLVATAGSCFAQHVSRKLSTLGFHFMVTEREPLFPFSGTENFGVFSARYGNVYTVRQFKQLFWRAHGLFEPADRYWQREDGRYVDPFRPYIAPEGFASPDEVAKEREAHLAAVRDLFEDCDVFILTLGLTEGWVSVQDGAVFPLAPGVVGAQGYEADYRFRNFTVAEMEKDLRDVLLRLHAINPGCRVLLTVSPVALIATYEDTHVLAATTYSKSALRVVAEGAKREFDFVDYFPSYEMIMGPHGRGAFLEDDLREVRPEGVEYAMAAFARHYLGSGMPVRMSVEAAPTAEQVAKQKLAMKEIASVICDEENIDRVL